MIINNKSRRFNYPNGFSRGRKIQILVHCFKNHQLLRGYAKQYSDFKICLRSEQVKYWQAPHNDLRLRYNNSGYNLKNQFSPIATFQLFCGCEKVFRRLWRCYSRGCTVIVRVCCTTCESHTAPMCCDMAARPNHNHSWQSLPGVLHLILEVFQKWLFLLH